MATLTPKDIFRLKVELSGCYSTPNEAHAIMTHAGLNPGQVVLVGTARQIWQNILDYAQQIDRLIDLLAVVADQQADNLIINQLLKELREGRQIRLQALTRSIRSRQCILFLGPNTLRCKEKGVSIPPFNQVLARAMARDLDECDVYFAESERDNLSYIAQRYTEIPNYVLGEQSRKALNVYNKSTIDDSIYRSLAPLPWKVIINTNPDDQLAQIMEDENYGPCQHSYYSIANQPNLLSATHFPADSDGVLIYNLFGSFKEPSSILLTESQFLCFTRKTLAKDPALDPKVRGEFESPDYYYLFLGFDFGQWYAKIIFDTILKLTRQENHAFSAFPTGVAINQSNREFFEEEFKIYFVSDDMDTYLDAIIECYSEPVLS